MSNTVEAIIDENGVARNEDGEKVLHPSHRVRSSDASTFDFICMVCDATDQVPGGWAALAEPCSRETN